MMINIGFSIVFVVLSILKPALVYAGLGMLLVHTSLRLLARRLSAAYLDQQLST